MVALPSHTHAASCTHPIPYAMWLAGVNIHGDWLIIAVIPLFEPVGSATTKQIKIKTKQTKYHRVAFERRTEQTTQLTHPRLPLHVEKAVTRAPLTRPYHPCSLLLDRFSNLQRQAISQHLAQSLQGRHGIALRLRGG